MKRVCRHTLVKSLFKFEEFGTRSIENYVKDTITMYEALIEAEKALEQYAK